VGEFLAVSAFRDASRDDLVDAVSAYVSKHGVAFDLVKDGSRRDVDAHLFPSANGWTVILWPPFFNFHDAPLCAAVSRELGVLVSTVNVDDGDFWTHILFDRGDVVDRFVSVPSYFGGSDDGPETWVGDAVRVSATLGTLPAQIAPYLVEVDPEKGGLGKAFDDDTFDLDDYWVFTDMWRRMGITYPDVGSYERVLRFGEDFSRGLPTKLGDDS
jgi:hypothetical protein